jgi:hypothetical protein
MTMKYKDSATFRKALETRLRKMVAFERFLARLIADQPDTWVLKGGLSRQTA